MFGHGELQVFAKTAPASLAPPQNRPMNLTDRGFTGSIPELFEPYALDLAARVAALQPAEVLEIAAGTGVLTRRLVAELPPDTAIVASDLNATMIDMAATLGTERPVEWRLADAMDLPFEDES